MLYATLTGEAHSASNTASGRREQHGPAGALLRHRCERRYRDAAAFTLARPNGSPMCLPSISPVSRSEITSSPTIPLIQKTSRIQNNAYPYVGILGV